MVNYDKSLMLVLTLLSSGWTCPKTTPALDICIVLRGQLDDRIFGKMGHGPEAGDDIGGIRCDWGHA